MKHTFSWLRRLALFASTAFAVSSGLAEGEDSLLKTCVECHGADGIGRKTGIPHLNGQTSSYLFDSLRAFDKELRGTRIPEHKGIGREAARTLAEHYSGQKAERPKSDIDSALLARGEELYVARCADCHPDNGREADKDAPLLAAQDLAYLIAQTLAFKRGERRFAVMMEDAYRGLSDADLTAIAHFFASQPQYLSKVKKRRRNSG